MANFNHVEKMQFILYLSKHILIANGKKVENSILQNMRLAQMLPNQIFHIFCFYNYNLVLVTAFHIQLGIMDDE